MGFKNNNDSQISPPSNLLFVDSYRHDECTDIICHKHFAKICDVKRYKKLVCLLTNCFQEPSEMMPCPRLEIRMHL